MTKDVDLEFLKKCEWLGLKPTTELKTLFISGITFGFETAVKINERAFAKKVRK